MKNDLIILTGPIRSGKTTALKAFCERNKTVGWLTPDVNDKRVMIDIATNEVIRMEVEATESTIQVGKFNFSISVFDKGQEIVDRSIEEDVTWFVIDEIGRLELKDKGFHVAFENALNHISPHLTLLIVVRESLLEQVIEKYSLNHARVVNKDWLLEDYSFNH